MIGLEPVDVDAVTTGRLAHHGFDLGQRRPSVDLGLPLPQQVEVGAVQDADAHSALEILQPGVELVEVVALRVRGARRAGRGAVRSPEELVVRYAAGRAGPGGRYGRRRGR